MDTLKTKAELEADKAVLDSKLAALQTKEGADAFIASEIAALDDVLANLPDPKPSAAGRLSMKQFLEHIKTFYQTAPTVAVERELARTEQTLIELDKAMATVKADVEPIGIEEVKS